MSFVLSTQAQTITWDGVLGNSGQQGAALVRFGSVGSSTKGPIAGGTAAGMGVAYDRFGSLWDRGGSGTLNRYALDGRLLGQYQIPHGIGRNDQLILVGDTLVMQLQDKLFTLPITAAAGTAAIALKRASLALSFGTFQDQFASWSGSEILLVNPLTGQARTVMTATNVQQLELGPDGALYVATGGKVHKYVAGQEIVQGWPRNVPGERMQLLDGAFYGQAWHGTIRRFTSGLEPDPGVVLGGSSGSFIGHLDQNSELSNGRGLARIRPGLYAVSGFTGTLHLLAWDAQKQQFQIVRRIGCAPVGHGLAVDRSGNVWWHYGAWKWSDTPATPLQSGINAPEEIATPVMLESDHLVAPAWMWGKPTFLNGPLTTEVEIHRVENGKCDLLRPLMASVVYKSAGRLVLLAAGPTGKVAAFNIGTDGKYASDAAPVTLATASPIKSLASLAMKDANTLLIAADGSVIELALSGNSWKESRRWSQWAGDHFGAEICLACDAGRLWIADTQRQRVLVFDAASGNLLAGCGLVDKPGADLRQFDAPRTIAARNHRAVVYDAGNQRLVKLLFK
ncbi:MAG: hypothetical protein WCO56_12990 [Verrucomicrobiota bacterium]